MGSRAIEQLREFAYICTEMAHYMQMEEEFLRTMYFAGIRGHEIKQEWKDGQRRSAAHVADYRDQYRKMKKELYL